MLSALRGGATDNSAWRDFFDRYGSAVFRVARMRGLHHCDADDVVQQVMIAVSTHISGFDYKRDRGKFRQWIRRITERKIVDYFRKCAANKRKINNKVLNALTEECQLAPDKMWEREWQLQDTNWCLDQVAIDVSPRRMEAFRRYVLDGQSARVVALSLEMTEGYVYVTRFYILDLIRKKMNHLRRCAGA